MKKSPISILILFLLLKTVDLFSQSDELSKLLSKYNTSTEHDLKQEALAELSQYYLDQHPDSSLFYGQLYLKSAKSDFEFSIGNSICGISCIYLGDFEKAKYYEFNYLKHALLENRDRVIGSANNDLGMVYDYLGQYDSAIYYYEAAIKYRYKAKDFGACQGSLSNIGLVYYLKGDITSALKYLYEAYRLSEQLNDQNGIASSATNISLAFLKLKNFNKALEYTEIAQRVFEKTNSKKDLAMGLNNFGSIYHALEEDNKAIEYHFKSLKIKQEIGDVLGIAMSYQNLGSAYLALDSFALSEKYLLMGKSIADTLDDPVAKIEINTALLNLYDVTGETAKGIKILDDALFIYQNELIEYVNIYETFKHGSKLYAKIGDYKNAYHYATRSYSLKDSVENSENSNILAQKEAEHIYDKKKKEDEITKAKEKLKSDAELHKRENYNNMLIVGLCSMIVVLFFVFKSNREKKKANKLLQSQNEQITVQHREISSQKHIIEEKNKDITDSIQYAKRLQDAILPNESLMQNLLKDYFVLYQPKDIVSGDFYWIVELAQDDFLFAVVDCTGHGVPGGFVSIVAHNALIRAVKEFKLKEPADILNKINEIIEENFKQNDGQSIRDGMDIALCRKTGTKITFSGANNPLWLARKEENKISLTEFKADKQPIGYYINRNPFVQQNIELQKGDIIYLFSDGYADQFGGPQGKKFKYSQFKDLLTRSFTLTMNEQKLELTKQFTNWKGQLEQIDDICVLGIRI